jgi:tripartite-type tricarboxylate transporter receptor subunit TctC
MTLPRRKFLRLAAGAAALPVLPRAASALDYPTKPVHIIVGFPPGGTTDVSARLMGRWLSERLGQPFIIENRPGAGGNIAAEVVSKAPPDGYTLFPASAANTFNATIYDNLNFNFVRDFAPVAGFLRVPNVMVVNLSVPAKSVPEFIAYAKANPGKINMATAGKGSTLHVFGELFEMMAGVKLITVHYRGGGPALTDLLGGQVQLMFDPLGEGIGHVKAGRLRALAVTSKTRSPALPDVPTIGEFIPGFEANGWSGLSAPRNTPIDIIDRLNQQINAGLADPKLKAQLADLGATPMPMTPSDFGKFIVEETEKWAKVIRTANIKPE